MHLNERKKWLANYIKVGDQADPNKNDSTPLLSSKHGYTVLFLVDEQKLIVLFTLQSEAET